jgi:hypothetical protein
MLGKLWSPWLALGSPNSAARGGAQPPFLLLLARQKEGKEKAHPRLGWRYTPTALRALAEDRRCEIVSGHP